MKNEIIRKAMEMFALNGYENVGVQSIVEAVSVTKPTLYHHFGSKEGLLISILDTYYMTYFDELEKNAFYQQDIICTIETVMDYYIKMVRKNSDFYRLTRSLQTSSPSSEAYRIISKYYLKELEIFQNMFGVIAKHHTNLKDKEETLAFTIKGILDGYCNYTMMNVQEVEVLQNNPYKLAKQFLYGIFSL